MVAVGPLSNQAPPAPADEAGESRIVLRDVTYKDYVLLGDVLGHRPSLRLTYLEGTLEIMVTSRKHEHLKTLLARLLELYALVRGVRIAGYGNATFRREEAQRGLEADECYCVGAVKDYPDLAIEIVVSSPLVDKLAVYRGLGVREVWVYEGERLGIRHLEADGYVVAPRSTFFPDLDPELVATHLRMPDQDDAVRAFWESLGPAAG